MNQDNTLPLKNCTITLYRTWPWENASGIVFVPIIDNSGLADIEGIEAFGQNIFSEGNKKIASGKLIATVTDNSSGQNQAKSQRELKLEFIDLRQTGSFQTAVKVNGPALSEPITIPLKLEVTEFWVFPLIAIFLGIVGGFFLSYYSKKWKPRQENVYRILKYRNELEPFTKVIRDEVKRKKLNDIREKLNDAEEMNNRNEFKQAQDLLKEIDKSIDQFQQDYEKERLDTHTKIEEFETDINRYQQSYEEVFDNDERKEWDNIKKEFLPVKYHFSLDEVDKAKSILMTCRGEFSGFRRKQLEKGIEELENEINKVEESKKEKICKLIQDTKNALQESDYKSAEEKLGDLQKEVNNDRTPVVNRGGDNAHFGRLPFMHKFFSRRDGVEEPLPQGLPEAKLKVIHEHKYLITRKKISFQILMPEGQEIKKDEVVLWDFDDGEPTIEINGSGEATHPFDKPGTYMVEARVMSGNSVRKYVNCQVKIFQSRKEKIIEKTWKSINRAELLLSFTSLLLASITGMWQFYFGKTFGSLEDYFLAFLWGFGIDQTVKGFSSVLSRIANPS